MQKFQAKLKDLWEKVKGFFKKLNKKMRILLGVCLVVVLAAVILLSLRMNQKEYTTLFTGLTASETSTVVKFLSDNGVTDYQIKDDTILVPAGRETQLQSALIMSGNLKDAFLYPYYTDKIGALSTTDERDQALLISAQERLEAIIQTFEGVQEAWVTISPATKQVYVIQDSATPAKASVKVTTEGGRMLDDDVVRAIRYTVSHSVQGLNIEDISIEDQYGSPYSDTSVISKSNQATALKMQYEEQINNNVRSQIFQTLGRIYGEDNVTVSVLCSVEVTHKVIDRKDYTQPAGSVIGGGLIVGDTLFQEIIRDGTTPTGGTVGTTTNSDVGGDNFPTYPDMTQNLDGNEEYVGNEIDRTGVVNETKEQEEVLEGRLKDLRVVVAVNQNGENAGAMTIDALRDQVATLAGIGSDDPLSRVHVSIVPFQSRGDLAPTGPGGIFSMENSWILYAAIGGLVLFVILLILILLLARRRKKKRLAQQQILEEEMLAAQAAAEAAAIIAAAPPTGGADIMEVNTEKSMELRKQVRQFAQNNPEIAAQMVRAWLKGEENGG